MTTRSETPPASAARTLHWLALPLLLLVGCASAPFSHPAPAPTRPAPVAVSAPEPANAPTPPPRRAPRRAAPARRTVAAPVPVDPLRPDVRLDLDDRAARVDLWERVRRGFAMPDLDNELVRDRERWYASRPDYVRA